MEDEQPKVTITDRVLAATFLRLIPKSVRPNHITVVRFILTPFVIWLFWRDHYAWGAVLFLLASFTDALDGALARVRDQITDWGKLYDPFADKILICSTVYILVLRYIDIFTAWLIIIVEAIILIAALVKKSYGGTVQANVWGKIKMIFQVLGVMLLLLAIILNWAALFPFSSGVFYLAIAFAILSLFTYSI